MLNLPFPTIKYILLSIIFYSILLESFLNFLKLRKKEENMSNYAKMSYIFVNTFANFLAFSDHLLHNLLL